MKKLFLALLVFILSFVVGTGVSSAFSPTDKVFSSMEQTADATIFTGRGYFHQLIIMPDGTNAVTVSIYDNTASSGDEILPTMTFAGDGGPQATPPTWIAVNTGIRVDVSVAGAGTVAYVVLWRGQ